MGKIAITGNPVVDRIKETASQKGISLKFLCEKIGRGKTYFSDVVNGSGEIPHDRLKIISEILGTSTQYLLTGKEIEKAPALTEKDERDIARDVERIMDDLSGSGELMFDGVPMSDEAKAAMASAMRVGLEEAKLRNKETYTPKKYRKG